MTRKYEAFMFDLEHRMMGGLMGMLIGDSLGVPYEFHSPDEIPEPELIEMTPPPGFARAHAGVPAGTWSDDGAQALCLLDSLLRCDALDLQDFGDSLLRWHNQGYMTPDGRVFDCGVQTHMALARLLSGALPENAGGNGERDNGNGSLMRVLPLALWHRGTDAELVRDAHTQSLVTHGHVRSQVCCALYCLWARELLVNARNTKLDWRDIAEKKLLAIYSNMDGAEAFPAEYAHELQQILGYGIFREPQGTGYVVDSLWSARHALRAGSYEEVVRSAIRYGHDTDTTACIAGGLAGIRFGVDRIPSRWKAALRGKEIYFPLIEKLFARQIDVSNPPRRVIEMVAALINMGYQRLRYYPYFGPSGYYRFLLTTEQPCHRTNHDCERTLHLSAYGDGGTFGWGDSRWDTPDVLAQKLLQANPKFAELAYGPDPVYAQWFQETLKRLGPWKAFTFWQEVEDPFCESGHISVQTDDGTEPHIPFPPGYQPIVRG